MNNIVLVSYTIFLHVISMGLRLYLLWSSFLKKLRQNCQYILEIVSHKTLTRTNIPVPSVILVFNAPQYSDKCNSKDATW